MALNIDAAARVLVDAIEHGDKTAADKHGISTKTVERYRARMQLDPQLSETVRALAARAAQGWGMARIKTLRIGLAKMEELIGNLEITEGALRWGSRGY